MDPALDEIREAHAAGSLVIVAGPLVSAGAGLPSLAEVLGRLVARAERRRPEAAEAIAELTTLVAARRVPEAFSAARSILGPEYHDEVEKALGGSDPPVPTLARAVAALSPELSAVLTINLDRTLERAFGGGWPAFDRAVADLGQRRGFILKLHGTIERRAGWILTAEEHDRALYADPRHQEVVDALFRTRRVLFVGCELDEPGLSTLLGRLRALSGGQAPRHFALLPGAAPARRMLLDQAGVAVVACEPGDGVVALLSAIAGRAPERAQAKAEDAPVSTGTARCPYPGLGVFEAEDDRDFFGRDAEIADAVSRLGGARAAHRRWLQIEGPSGAGKSSLARAGLVPAVVDKAWVLGAPVRWRHAVLRPGKDPVRSLVKALLGPLAITEAGALDRLARDFEASSTALASLVEERLGADEALLLVVDQLEEAFTLAAPEALDPFDAVLAEAVRAVRGRTYLLTTIRSDFVGRFEALPRLGALLNAGEEAARYALEPMSGPALREAIERPAERAGLRWEAGLADRILEDASALEGGLPLVAHVLRALWGARRGRALAHHAYDALGGVPGALTRSADEVLEELDDGRRERARRMLLGLVKIGRGAGDTRRTASRDEVLAAGGGGAEAERVLLELSGGGVDGVAGHLRLVVVGKERVDLVHEALIRRWKTLRAWIEESRKALERRDDLEAAALTWEAAGKPQDGLPGVGQAAHFAGAEAPSERARGFLRAAGDKERKRIHRVRAIIAGLAAGVLAMAGLAGAAVHQRRLAQERLLQAIGVANEVNFTIDGELEKVAGAAAARKKLLDRVAALQDQLLEGAGDSKEALRSRMVTHLQRGDLARTHDDLALARREYDAAMSIASALLRADPSDAGLQRDISLAYDKIGEVARAGGDLPAAAAAHRKSLALTEALLKATPTSAGLKRDLAVDQERLGDLATASGDRGEARAAHGKALALRQALLNGDPTNTGLRRELSVSYNKIGDVARADGDLPAARAAYEESLDLIVALVEADPTNPALRRDLAISHNKIGDAASADDDPLTARAAYEEALESFEVLLQADPKNAQLQHDLVVSYNKLGNVAWASDDLPATRAAYEKSLKLRDALVEADPGNAGWQVDLITAHVLLIAVARSAGDAEAVDAHRIAARAALDRLDREGKSKGNAHVANLRAILDREGG